MYIPAWAILLMMFGIMVSVISALASLKGISLLKFWSIPFAMVLPWILVLLMVFVCTIFQKDQSRGQAMAMSGMFPMGGLIFAFFIGFIASFFISPQILLRTRFLWSLGISSIPAFVLGLFLLYVSLN